MVMLGRSVSLTTLFLGRLKPSNCKRLTSTNAHASYWQLPFLNQQKEERKNVAWQVKEAGTSDSWVRHVPAALQGLPPLHPNKLPLKGSSEELLQHNAFEPKKKEKMVWINESPSPGPKVSWVDPAKVRILVMVLFITLFFFFFWQIIK